MREEISGVSSRIAGGFPTFLGGQVWTWRRPPVNLCRAVQLLRN
jgi:hypothetical protein